MKILIVIYNKIMSLKNPMIINIKFKAIEATFKIIKIVFFKTIKMIKVLTN